MITDGVLAHGPEEPVTVGNSFLLLIFEANTTADAFLLASTDGVGVADRVRRWEITVAVAVTVSSSLSVVGSGCQERACPREVLGSQIQLGSGPC